MRIQIIMALSILVLASACDEDSFSQTVNIPIPEHEPLPAFSMDLRSGDTNVVFLLGLSRGILEGPEITGEMATLEVFQDGEPFLNERFPIETNGGLSRSISLSASTGDSIPVGPTTYRVVATIDGFDPVETTQVMPAAPNYDFVSYEADGAIDSEGYRVDEIELDLNDNAATEDYYGFRVLVPQQNCEFDQVGDSLICEFTFEFTYPAYIDSQDPLLKNSAGFGLVITDQSFNGDTYRIRLLADSYQDAPLRLEVYRITEDAYRYAVSRRAYDDAGDNPFAEPVNIHNNVEGGYGFFIAASKTTRQLQ